MSFPGRGTSFTGTQVHSAALLFQTKKSKQKPKCDGEVKMKLKVEVPIMDVWYFMIRI